MNGVPTEAARKRLDAAIFQRAYGQPGLTQLLDNSQVPRGIQGTLRAMREIAPRVLDLDNAGDLDFRPALADVMNEVQANRASGKNLSLRELADQQTLDRSPEAQAILDYLATNEENKGGYKALVQTFQELTDWVKAQQESMAQGDGLFGAAPQPTRRDLMREFARITGQKFDPTQYNRFDSMHETVKAELLNEAKRADEARAAERQTSAARAVDDSPAAETSAQTEAVPEQTSTTQQEAPSQAEPEIEEASLFGEEPEQPSLLEVADVAEQVRDRTDAEVVRQSMEHIRATDSGDASLDRAVQQALEDDPQLTMSFEDGGSMKAADYIATRDAEAERLEHVANEGVSTAAICAMLNNGI